MDIPGNKITGDYSAFVEVLAIAAGGDVNVERGWE